MLASRWSVVGAALTLWLLSIPAVSSAQTPIVVNRTDDPSPAGLACAGVPNDCSLRAAIIKANTSPGPDSITLPAGIYTLTIASTDDEYNFAGAVATTGDLDVFDNDGDAGQVSDLTLTGDGSATTIVQGAPDIGTTPIDRIFDIENVYGSPSAEGLHFTLTGVTLRFGSAPTLSTAEGSFYQSGGAINFDGCKSSTGPCASRGVLTLTDVIITNNQAAGPGGGVHARNIGGITLTDVRFISNTSTLNSGGALYHLGSLLDGSISIASGGLNASSFTTNAALATGGGIRLGLIGGSSTVTIANTNFTTNSSGIGTPFGGGAIAVENSSRVTISGGSFVTNRAANHGGAIYVYGAGSNDVVTLSGVDLRENTADYGDNGSGDGGAIYAAHGEVRVLGSLVRDNIAVNGAGIAAASTIGNPRVTVRNTTLTGNLAKALGGAVFFNNSFTPSPASATLTNVTITANRANTANASGSGFGGGVARSSGAFAVENTIISGNFNGASPSTTADEGQATAGVTANFSLIQTTTNFTFTGANNLTGVNPLLGPLQDNGGSVPSFALQFLSPAIEAGSNALATAAGLTTDQRGAGFVRALDSADANTTATVDIGAYEVHPSIENIGNATTNEDTAAEVTFNVGDAPAGFSSIAATSNNAAVIANGGLVVSGDGSTRTLTMSPVANAFGTATITVVVSATVSGSTQQMSDTFVLTVLPVADPPTVSATTFDEDTQSTSGLVVTRNVVDGTEVTHFKITAAENGTVFKTDGTTAIANNAFITFAEANAGLRFTSTPNKNSFADSIGFVVQGATSAVGAGLGVGTTPSITVTSIGDPPTITAATTAEDTQSTSGLVVGRNVVDSTDITHFKITGIAGGALFKANGTTAIVDDAFITFAEGTAGLRFTPAANAFSPDTAFGFAAAAATNGSGAGLSVATNASITVTATAEAPAITDAATNEDTQTSAGLVIARNDIDGAEVTHFKITGITNGTLFKSNGTTAIANDDVITLAEGSAGLRFTPAANAFSPGTSFGITAAGATSAAGAGLGVGTAASITVTPVADPPSVSATTFNEDTQSTSGLVVTRNVADGAEVTHFKITATENGTVFKSDGTTAIADNAVITYAEANAGLRFTSAPNKNSFADTIAFVVQGATSAGGAGLGAGTTPSITVTSIGDPPTITAATTAEDTQSASGLVVGRNVVDSTDITHFKITGVAGGALFKANGTTAIADNDFIAFAEGNAGLKFTPAANAFSPDTTFAFAAAAATNGSGAGLSVATNASITVTATAEAPTITDAATNEDTQTSAGLVIARSGIDGAEVTHFKITGITNGTLFKSNGTTAIANDDVITLAEGGAGLKFTPAANAYSPGTSFAFTAAGATSAAGAGVGVGTAASITVTAIADAPTITAASTPEDTQSSSGLVIGRNAADGAEVTHFKITGITGGALFKANGTTAIADNDLLTFADGNAGLRFTPAANAFSPDTTFTFAAAAATNDSGAGLSVTTNAAITVTATAEAPTITAATTNEDTQTSAGLVIARHGTDGAEVTHFKITGITNGTLFKNNGTTAIAADDVITFAEGNAGLRFTPAANAFSPGTSFSFTAAGATSAVGAGLGAGTAASITVTPLADAPTITAATTNEDTQTSSGLVIARNAADGGEITHFRISSIVNGALFKSDGSTAIGANSFITAAEADAGVKFTPAANAFSPGTTFSFTAAGATSSGGAGLGGGTAASITVAPIADTPSITDATTSKGVQTTSGLVITRNAADGAEVSHVKVAGFTNGQLFKNDGTTALAANDVITFAEGSAGLKFTPAAGMSSPSATFSVAVQGATSAGAAGLSGAATAAITVLEPPVITTHPQSRTIRPGGSASLTVSASGPSLGYQWYVGSSGATSAPVSGATAATYTSGSLSETTSYWVRVSNSSGNADSNTAIVTVGAYELFTDHDLVDGVTPLRAVHISELRGRINTQRERFGLQPFVWTDAVLVPGTTAVKRIHIVEMREALVQAYGAAGAAAPAFSDATLTAGVTVIMRLHIVELRDAVIALESRP